MERRKKTNERWKIGKRGGEKLRKKEGIKTMDERECNK